MTNWMDEKNGEEMKKYKKLCTFDENDFPIPAENRKCEDCKKRKAIIDYAAEPFLAISHGWGILHICRECFIKRIENHLKDCKKQLKEQKELQKEKK